MNKKKNMNRNLLLSSIAGMALLTASSTTLSGCGWIPSVGPDYERPADPTVPGWILDESGKKLFSLSTENRTAWWSQFKDPVLDNIIAIGIQKNLNYQIAKARLEQARSGEYGAISAFLPGVDGLYNMNRQEQSPRTSIGRFNPQAFNQYQAGLDAAWEIDIFGGNRRNLEAAESLTEAAEASVDDTAVTVASEIAINYFQYRALTRRVQIAQDNVKTQQESLNLVQAKFDAGVVSELDLQQQKAQLATTASLVPTLATQRDQNLYRVAVLLGEVPQTYSIAPDPMIGDKAFEFHDTIAVSIPGEFLRVRPDVRVAERQLAAQTADIGVAIAEVFPKVSISAALGVQANKSNSLIERGSRYWSFAPGLTLPIFQPKILFSDIKNAREKADEAVKNYELAVLTALEDAQNSINGYKNSLERISQLEDATSASKRALELSQDLYRQGLVDFQRVLDAQRTVFSAEDSLLQGRQDTFTAAIAVYKAFAGGLPEVTTAAETEKKNDNDKPAETPTPTM